MGYKGLEGVVLWAVALVSVHHFFRSPYRCSYKGGMTFIKLRGEVWVTGEGVERARDEGRPPKPPPPIKCT